MIDPRPILFLLTIAVGIVAGIAFKNQRKIEEQRKYVAGLLTANILEGLKVSDKELKEKLLEIWDVEE